MPITSRYRVNTEELNRLCLERGWGLNELSEESGISKPHLWKMTLPTDDQRFSGIGPTARKKLRKIFPKSQGLFLPFDLQN